MKKNLLQFVALSCAAVFGAACADAPTVTSPTNVDIPVSAAPIKYGQLDGAKHPAVVLIIMDVDGAPAFRCSGMLIAPLFVLTAGHCTGEPGELSALRVFTEADVQPGNNNYPFAGPNTVEAAS